VLEIAGQISSIVVLTSPCSHVAISIVFFIHYNYCHLLFCEGWPRRRLKAKARSRDLAWRRSFRNNALRLHSSKESCPDKLPRQALDHPSDSDSSSPLFSVYITTSHCRSSSSLRPHPRCFGDIASTAASQRQRASPAHSTSRHRTSCPPQVAHTLVPQRICAA